MRLSCQRALLLLTVSTLACHDTSGPVGTASVFILNDINDRTLPTYLAPTPGLTPTIVSGTLTLETTGQAVMTEHRIGFDGVEVELVSQYTYTINGGRIQFERLQPCPINALCTAPPTGTIFLNTLALQIGGPNSAPIIYNYRLSPAL